MSCIVALMMFFLGFVVGIREGYSNAEEHIRYELLTNPNGTSVLDYDIKLTEGNEDAE